MGNVEQLPERHQLARAFRTFASAIEAMDRLQGAVDLERLDDSLIIIKRAKWLRQNEPDSVPLLTTLEQIHAELMTIRPLFNLVDDYGRKGARKLSELADMLEGRGTAD